jgi:metal-responsive CopG/Arc/MetJ family transcriptional regulator
VVAVKVVSFKIEEDLLAQLEEFSKKRGVSKSEVIRRALRYYIMEEERKEKVFTGRGIRIW